MPARLLRTLPLDLFSPLHLLFEDFTTLRIVLRAHLVLVILVEHKVLDVFVELFVAMRPAQSANGRQNDGSAGDQPYVNGPAVR